MHAFTHRAKQLRDRLLVCAVVALVSACAAAPKPVAPPISTQVLAPAVAPKQARLDRLLAALGELGFEQHDESLRLTLPQPIVFPFDGDQVADAARLSIGRVGRELSALEVGRVFVYGHTDNVGPPLYNKALSLRRAEAVAQILIDNGVAKERIERSGLGAAVAVASNATTAGRAKNRRVVIVVQVD